MTRQPQFRTQQTDARIRLQKRDRRPECPGLPPGIVVGKRDEGCVCCDNPIVAPRRAGVVPPTNDSHRRIALRQAACGVIGRRVIDDDDFRFFRQSLQTIERVHQLVTSIVGQHHHRNQWRLGKARPGSLHGSRHGSGTKVCCPRSIRPPAPGVACEPPLTAMPRAAPIRMNRLRHGRSLTHRSQSRAVPPCMLVFAVDVIVVKSV